MIFFLFKLSTTTVASKESNSGSVSPIGEAVAIFPANVATFLICVEPYLFKILVKSG